VIGIYYIFNIIFVSISLAATVLVLKIHHNGNNNSRVPEWIKKILFLKLDFEQEIEQTKIENFKYTKQRNGFQNMNETFLETLNFSEKKNNKRLIIFKKILGIGKRFIESYKKKRVDSVCNEILNKEWCQVARRIDQIFFFISIITVKATPVYLFSKFLLNDKIENIFLKECSC
jgi:hypothetical protein